MHVRASAEVDFGIAMRLQELQQRQGILHERDSPHAAAAGAPSSRAHPAHDEVEEIGRIGQGACFPCAVHAREDFGA